MKFIRVSFILLSLFILGINSSCNRHSTNDKISENTSPWTSLEKITLPEKFFKDIPNTERSNIIYSLFSLDQPLLDQLLHQCPEQKQTEAIHSDCIVSFPHPNGDLISFKIISTQLMEPELADKFPELKTYEGISTNAAQTLIRITRNEHEIDAMVLSNEGTYYLLRIEIESQPAYLVYFKKDFIYNKNEGFFEPIQK